MSDWGNVYCKSWWGDESNKQSIPDKQSEKCAGGYEFTIKSDLVTAVNLWISDKALALDTYG